MKVRSGFVSNSSSSSFVAFGVTIDHDEWAAVFEDDIGERLEAALSPHDVAWQSDYDCGYTMIGLNPSSIRDDETGLEFKTRAKGLIRDIIGDELSLPDERFGWIEEVIGE